MARQFRESVFQSLPRFAQFWLISKAHRTINNNPRVKRHLGASVNERRDGRGEETRRTLYTEIPWSIDPSIFTCGLAFREESRAADSRFALFRSDDNRPRDKC